MKDIAIVGAGGFGREVKMLIDQINAVKPQYNFIGYFDDGIAKDNLVNGFPVLGMVEAVNNYIEPLAVVIAIGSPATKRKLLDKIKSNLISYETLIHPNVVIGNDGVSIGEGCIICAGNIFTVNISIGAHVVFNLACTVGHDTVIKNYCSFMPMVNISGEVLIGEQVFMGTGAKIINKIKIGEKTTVGAGAVVYKSLPANCTAIGVPAKVITYND
jgi:sugar O-acyltransferase (sialic acid O-acetyltransferase NeuD family)